MTTRHGIRVTTPARTLLDLAATLSRDRLERALDRSEILELTDYPALDAIARAHPNHRGANRLRAAIATYLAGTLTRSDLEALFLALCAAMGCRARASTTTSTAERSTSSSPSSA